MKIGDVMNRAPVILRKSSKLEEAAKRVSETQVSDLMIVEDDGTLMGVLSEGDLIRAALPNYGDLMGDEAPLHQAWKVFIAKGSELAVKPITPLVITAPVSFSPEEKLLKAAAAMINRQIRILPVVKDGKLVGTISRGDLAAAILRSYPSR